MTFKLVPPLPIRLVDKAAERVVLVSPLHSPSGALAAGLARARLVHGLCTAWACLGHVLCKGGLEAMTTNRIGMVGGLLLRGGPGWVPGERRRCAERPRAMDKACPLPW